MADYIFVLVEPYEYEVLCDCFYAIVEGNRYNDVIFTHVVQFTLYDNLEILFKDCKRNFIADMDTNVNIIESESQNLLSYYTNHFVTEKAFEINIKETAQIKLSVYDLQGRFRNYNKQFTERRTKF